MSNRNLWLAGGIAGVVLVVVAGAVAYARFPNLLNVASYFQTAADREKLCTDLAASPYEAGFATTGVPIDKIDTAKAIDACRAALADNPASPQINYRLARALEQNKDYAESGSKDLVAAQANYAPAQSNLAALYYGGLGLPKDHALAAYWYQKAADNGFVMAQAQLAAMYLTGDSVDRDVSKAADLYRKASDQGFAMAQENLARLYLDGTGVPADDAQAFALFQKAADQNYPDAQYDLGWMYENGRGVTADLAKAADLYRKAADAGDERAQFALGSMLAEGRGVSRNDSEAVTWLRKSADQNYPDAQNYLGMMYKFGRGVSASDADAVSLFQKASDQGLADAQNNLGWMIANGRGAPQDAVKAFSLFSTAANQGDVLGEYNVALDYADGSGVGQDMGKAIEWYKKAADGGYQPAQAALDNISQTIARLSAAIDRVLDALVSADSRDWAFNHYDQGSMTGGDIFGRSTDGSTLVIGGNYTFNNGQHGWAKVRLVNGHFNCIEFWDFAGTCRTLRSADGDAILASLNSDLSTTASPPANAYSSDDGGASASYKRPQSTLGGASGSGDAAH